MIIFIEKLKNSSLEINQVYRASMHVHDVHVSIVSRPIKSIFRNLTFINLHFGVAHSTLNH